MSGTAPERNDAAAAPTRALPLPLWIALVVVLTGAFLALGRALG